MSQRTAKIESLVQQTVAIELRELLDHHLGEVTVTRVDAAPDLRTAVVWIGLLVGGSDREAVWKEIEAIRPEIQAELAAKMTTKFVPRLTFKIDTGGEYAQTIAKIIKKIS